MSSNRKAAVVLVVVLLSLLGLVVLAGWAAVEAIRARSEENADEPSPVSEPPPSIHSSEPTEDPESPPSRAGSTAPLRPRVTIRPPTVRGGRIIHVENVVSRLYRPFRSCYQNGLETDPELRGTVVLEAGVGPSGEVVDVSGGAGGRLQAVVVPCMKAAVAKVRFGSPDRSGAVVLIVVELVLR